MGAVQDLNDLRFFVEVVQQNGFAAAARKLGIPRSRLSRRIGLLEEHLGVRLIQRSTRRFAVTEIGREYYRHCLAMMVEAEAAQETIDRLRSEPQGVVRVSCPSSLIYFQLGKMIARFMVQCPKVEVLLESTNRRVDVIREGFDLAIRVRVLPLDDSDLVIRKLAESPAATGREFLRAGGSLPPARSRRPCYPAEPRMGAGEARTRMAPRWPRCRHRDHSASAAFRERGHGGAAPRGLRGVGICQLPTFVVEEDLQAGRLIDVLPEWLPKTGMIHAAFPSRRGLLPSVRALLDFVAAEYDFLTRRRQDFTGSGPRPSF